jgi:hypothetical protein
VPIPIVSEIFILRSQQSDFVSLSFDTISGIGPNGAIIHYKAQPETCAKITKDQVCKWQEPSHVGSCICVTQEDNIEMEQLMLQELTTLVSQQTIKYGMRNAI